MSWRAGGDGRPVSIPQLPWKEECYSCSLVGDRADYTLVAFDDDRSPSQAYLCPTCSSGVT